SLIMQDSAGNLRLIVDLIKDAEQGGGPDAYSFTCKYIRASYAEHRLKDYLSVGTESATSPLAVKAPKGAAPKPRDTSIVSDNRVNRVLVSGPADKIALAKQFLSQIDVGDLPIVLGNPVFRTYDVPNGNADALAKMLQQIFGDAPEILIRPASPTQLLA